MKENQPFYTQYWFWVIIMVIVMCCTRGRKNQIIVCGNCNGSGNTTNN